MKLRMLIVIVVILLLVAAVFLPIYGQGEKTSLIAKALTAGDLSRDFGWTNALQMAFCNDPTRPPKPADCRTAKSVSIGAAFASPAAPTDKKKARATTNNKKPAKKTVEYIDLRFGFKFAYDKSLEARAVNKKGQPPAVFVGKKGEMEDRFVIVQLADHESPLDYALGVQADAKKSSSTVKIIGGRTTFISGIGVGYILKISAKSDAGWVTQKNFWVEYHGELYWIYCNNKDGLEDWRQCLHTIQPSAKTKKEGK